MYKSVWKSCHPSVCCIHLVTHSGIKAVTCTGFKVDETIITEELVFRNHEIAEAQIHFTGEDGHEVTARVHLPYEEFLHRILNAAIDDPQGFSVIRADFAEFRNIPSLRLFQQENISIGENIVLLGYRHDHNNLSMLTGVVSSLFCQNSHQFIEVDSTIRQGYAGGPLIHAGTGEVLGIIGYRLASLNRTYNQMMKIINDNLKSLKEVEGKFTIQEIDPIQVLIASQNQIKHMANHFFKSTDIRTGIAHHIHHLVEYLHEMQPNKMMQRM